MGKIKIGDFKIITIKDGIKETWELGNGETQKFIKYNGKFWNLVKTEDITQNQSDIGPLGLYPIVLPV